MSSSYKTLDVTRSADGFVVTVELNRPEVLNAMNTAMGEELLHCFEAFQWDRTVRAVVESLSTSQAHRRWLLVFDNADEPEDLTPYLPYPIPTGHVLITSRNLGWSELASTVQVDVFERSESIALLRDRSKDISDEDADRLADRLGDRAERRVGDHGRLLAVHPHQLVAAHRQSTGDLGVQRAVRLLERDRRRLHPGDLADQRAQAGQVTAGTPGKNRPQGFGLLRGGTVIELQRHLPAAIGHPLRRAHRHHGVQARQVHAVLAAAGDMPRQQHVAIVVGRGSQPHAVATDIAVAHLEIVPLNRKGHLAPPSRRAGSAARTATLLP